MKLNINFRPKAVHMFTVYFIITWASSMVILATGWGIQGENFLTLPIIEKVRQHYIDAGHENLLSQASLIYQKDLFISAFVLLSFFIWLFRQGLFNSAIWRDLKSSDSLFWGSMAAGGTFLLFDTYTGIIDISKPSRFQNHIYDFEIIRGLLYTTIITPCITAILLASLYLMLACAAGRKNTRPRN